MTEPFTKELSADERDRLVRFAVDAWDVTAATAIGPYGWIKEGRGDGRELIRRWESASTGVAENWEFVLNVLRTVENVELGRLIADSGAPETAISSVLETARREGGIVELMQSRYSPGSTLFISNTEACAVGVVVLGAGVAAATVGAEVFAGIALVVGVVIIASAC
jgi:hypothetical protein